MSIWLSYHAVIIVILKHMEGKINYGISEKNQKENKTFEKKQSRYSSLVYLHKHSKT
jgi:hypothetical protein